jgi:hypothetical protein
MTAKQPSSQPANGLFRLAPLLVFLLSFALYVATAAPATLFGDPSEYQFVPAILGIAHPPGYAFYTLLAKLWQTVVPAGSIAFRTNLLAAAVGAWTVTAVYLIVRDIQSPISNLKPPAFTSSLTAVFAALSLAVASDFWQHAIHANAHIVSVALTTTHLWLLVRWWCTGQDRWLAAFAFTLGLAPTHHPITLVGVPAYALFIVVVRPRIMREWRTLLMLAGCFLLGLTPLLYYPLRLFSIPYGFGPAPDWGSLWRHITAQGLRVNLFHFGLADQPDRALVFWSLLRLQFPLFVIALSFVGLVWLARRAPKPALLICVFLLGHLLFTLNTVQDVMAYLLMPFAALAIAAGLGAAALLQPAHLRSQIPNPRLVIYSLVICSLVILFPLRQAVFNLQRDISLRDFTAVEEYVAAVYSRFAGRGEGAVLLSDWEHLTPLWVHIYTQGEPLDEQDVKLVYVNPAHPWVESVWQHIEEGPIYAVGYRPALRDAGFRLLPEGPFYRVVAPPATGVTPQYPLDVWADGRVRIVGYDMPTTTVRSGEPLTLVLYQSVTETLDGIWMPYAQLGPLEDRWTTDSRVLTPQWQPGETIAEEYEIPVPFNLPSGEYPLRLGYADLTGGRPALTLSTGGTAVELATVTVLPGPQNAITTPMLANLDDQVALAGARAWTGLQVRRAPWSEPLVVRAGRPLHLVLTWRALVRPRDSFTVFVHLIDSAGRYVTGHDYTPLGGSCPSYLWFPKWLPGQTMDDPYRLVLPADLPPGDYWLEVGMYGMTSLRRLSVVDLAGNLAGDRVILGPVQVRSGGN